MYRINLYPDHGQKKRLRRSRSVTMAALLALLGVEVLLVGVLVVSDRLLSERESSLRSELPAIRAKVEATDRPRPELDLALAMLSVRNGRLDWTPKLASIADQLADDLRFTEVEGRAGAKRERPRLVIHGEAKRRADSLAEVNVYMQRLREVHALKPDFPEISLGNISGDGSREFEVACEQPKETR